MTKGYIYIIEDEPETCKIGITKNCIKQRNTNLATQFHREFKIRGFYLSENIYHDEKVIHELLKDFRLKGEWFNLSYDKIKIKLSNLYQFDDYYEEKREKPKLQVKRSIYLTEDADAKFTEIYTKQLITKSGKDRSTLINEAIYLLYEKYT